METGGEGGGGLGGAKLSFPKIDLKNNTINKERTKLSLTGGEGVGAHWNH